MRERLTVMTRKGQITVPAEIRRALGLKIGDRVAVSLNPDGAPSATLRPARSVVDMTFGSITPRKRPEDFKELRELAIEDIAENAINEGRGNAPDSE